MYCEIDGTAVAVELGDVTQAGLFVQTTSSPATDSEVQVLLCVHELALRARGHVVQVVLRDRAITENRRPGFGLLFTHVEDAARAELRRALESAQAALLAATSTTQDQSEECALLMKLEEELRSLANKTPWAVLGVTQGSTHDEIKTAFFAASKRYHPHLFSRYQMPEIKRTVTELFIAHKRAYSSLEKRRAMRPGQHVPFAAPIVKSEPPKVAAPIAAPVGLVKSDPPAHTATQPIVVTKTDTSAKAAPSLPPSAASGAVPKRSIRPPEVRSRTVDSELELQAGLKLLAQSQWEDAEEHLRLAVQLNPASTKTRTWLLVAEARRAKAENDLTKALEKYCELLTLDPKHHEALNETKKYSKELQTKPGLFGRIFGSGSK